MTEYKAEEAARFEYVMNVMSEAPFILRLLNSSITRADAVKMWQLIGDISRELVLAGFNRIEGEVRPAQASGARYDFNALERRAAALIDADRPREAMAIYLFMGDGDPSLDAGYLAERIGRCCELLDDLHGAKWWYGRAVEENQEIPAYVAARRRLDSITIDPLLA